MVIQKLNIKGRPGRHHSTINKTPSIFTQKKYNIGRPTRVMPDSLGTPTRQTRQTRQTTPLTPRGQIFEDVLKKNRIYNKKIEIAENFVPDEDDIEKQQERMKMGIKSPNAYFTENILKRSRYTKKIGEKRKLSDMFYDANEELELDNEWLGKPDDPGGIPHKAQDTQDATRTKIRRRNNRRSLSRSSRRRSNRTRSHSRS
jgi:hypothetical protein